MTDLLKNANAVLNQLTIKHFDAKARLSKAEGRVKEIAFDAIACDDAAAKKEMAGLNTEGVRPLP